MNVFHGPHDVRFGRGTFEHLISTARDLRMERPVAVSDAHIADAVAAVMAGARTRVLVHDGREPTLQSIAGLRGQIDFSPDGVIAVGGGSTLDSGKALAINLARDVPLTTLEGDPTLQGIEPLPVLAVPTTAGTGSEVTGSAVIADGATRKVSLRSPLLLPRGAILDPSLLVSAPVKVRAAAGVDALTHAMEAYCSNRATPLTRSLALHAAHLVWRSLPDFVDDAENADAADEMAWGACMAGMAFNSARVGLAHAIASVIGPRAGIPHGFAVGMALPHALRVNSAASAVDWDAMRDHLGVTGEMGDAAESFLERVGAPLSVRQFGSHLEISSEMVDQVINSGRLDTNPVTVSAAQLTRIMEALAQ